MDKNYLTDKTPVVIRDVMTDATKIDALNKGSKDNGLSDVPVNEKSDMFSETRYVCHWLSLVLPVLFLGLAVFCGIDTYKDGEFKLFYVVCLLAMSGLMLLCSNYVMLCGKRIFLENMVYSSRFLTVCMDDVRYVKIRQDKFFYMMIIAVKPKTKGPNIYEGRFLPLMPGQVEELKQDLESRGVRVLG